MRTTEAPIEARKERSYIPSTEDLIDQLIERYDDILWAARVGPTFVELLYVSTNSVRICMAKAHGEPFRGERVADPLLDLLIEAERIVIVRERAEEAKNGKKKPQKAE